MEILQDDIYYLGNCLVNLFPTMQVWYFCLCRSLSTKTKIPNCIAFFAVPTIVETAMEALPLLIIYLFNQGRLDLVFSMC